MGCPCRTFREGTSGAHMCFLGGALAFVRPHMRVPENPAPRRRQLAQAGFSFFANASPRHADHLAAGCASDRGQPASARGVGEFG
jgi:hypothetical protein